MVPTLPKGDHAVFQATVLYYFQINRQDICHEKLTHKYYVLGFNEYGNTGTGSSDSCVPSQSGKYFRRKLLAAVSLDLLSCHGVLRSYVVRRKLLGGEFLTCAELHDSTGSRAERGPRQDLIMPLPD